MTRTERVKLARKARAALSLYTHSFKRHVSEYIENDLHEEINAYRVRQLRSAYAAVTALRDEEGWLE